MLFFENSILSTFFPTQNVNGIRFSSNKKAPQVLDLPNHVIATINIPFSL